jgi:hypothetical protein
MAVKRCRFLFMSEFFVLRDVPGRRDGPAAAFVEGTVRKPFSATYCRA